MSHPDVFFQPVRFHRLLYLLETAQDYGSNPGTLIGSDYTLIKSGPAGI